MLGLLVSYQTDVRLCVIFPERNDPNDVCVGGSHVSPGWSHLHYVTLNF